MMEIKMEWISVEDKTPSGTCLVYLSEPMLNSYMQVATYDGITIIGGYMEWDAPKVTHWMQLPEQPKMEIQNG
jgi:hypothetical protein